MSDPCLLAILFVSSSSKGSHLAFRWPARPKAVPRLARPRPLTDQHDYAWRAAHPSAERGYEPGDQPFSLRPNSSKERAEMTKGIDIESLEGDSPSHTPAYEWKLQDWSERWAAFTEPTQVHANSHSQRRSRSSRKNTTMNFHDNTYGHSDPDFDWVLGYRTKILAEHVLRADSNLCNQRFELILEELMFLGHPVGVGKDETWMWDQLYRGAERSSNLESGGDGVEGTMTEMHRQQAEVAAGSLPVKDHGKETSLKSFHFVLVLDRPDPALGGHLNLMRFFDVYYQQIAVKMTAALHFEQSRDNYVERETDLLVELMESHDSYAEFEKAALERSSLARAMRDLFIAVQSQRLAHVAVGAFELDLQMPWYHSELLSGEADPEGAGEYENEQDERWDPEFGKGWRVKKLHPWSTLLFLDGWEAATEIELESEEVAKFREVLTPDISLSDAAALLDWDLDTEVMRMARYMIYLKKAKVSDVVHPKLLNIYVLPARLTTSLSELSAQFHSVFPPTTPALETILAAVSSSPQAFYHFVPSHDHHELYHQILIWLLKNDALIMLHVRFRLVATKDVQEAVRLSIQQHRATSLGLPVEERGRKRKPSVLTGSRDEKIILSSTQTGSHTKASTKETSAQMSPERGTYYMADEREFSGLDVPEVVEETFINDPRRPSRLELLWIREIARRKPEYEKRFLRVCEFFDGRTTYDEIQYRSQLKRNQFRQIVEAYSGWLLSFLHP